jgi:hypothetical protein
MSSFPRRFSVSTGWITQSPRNYGTQICSIFRLVRIIFFVGICRKAQPKRLANRSISRSRKRSQIRSGSRFRSINCWDQTPVVCSTMQAQISPLETSHPNRQPR